MKSAAQSDHPQGISARLSCTCLAKIQSLISLRDLPRQGLLPVINQKPRIPRAKKSTAKVWFWRHMTSGAMQPGVPLVSAEFSSLKILAIPKSVIFKQPFQSSTRFQGLISRWMICLQWIYYKPWTMHPTINFVCSSLNRLCFEMWLRRSPPGIRSISRYRFSRSWKAASMLTMNSFLRLVSSFLQLRVLGTDFLVMITAFDISFRAYYL